MVKGALAVMVGVRAWLGPTNSGDDFVPHVLSVVGEQLVACVGREMHTGLPVRLLQQTTVEI